MDARVPRRRRGAVAAGAWVAQSARAHRNCREALHSVSVRPGMAGCIALKALGASLPRRAAEGGEAGLARSRSAKAAIRE